MNDPVLNFKFSGGDAEQNQLSFYDAGRFLYGAARLVYALEHFRQTGKVVDRITHKINVDYRIGTPKAGSWELGIIQAAAPVISEVLIKVPIDILVTWAIDKVTNQTSAKDTAIKLAQERTAQERERTDQSREETRRLMLMEKSNQKLLSILDEELKNKREIERDLREQLTQSQQELLTADVRAQTMGNYRAQLDTIDDAAQRKIASKTQSLLYEIGRPAVKSASSLHVFGSSSEKPIAFFNRRIIESFKGNMEDNVLTILDGNITRYDKVNGWGKFYHENFPQPLSFFVPAATKKEINLKIIESMKKTGVRLHFYFVKDIHGIVRHLVVDDVNDIPLT